jgi:single-strand DNA-binding protein
MAIGTVNRATIVGPLAADPTIRRTSTGRKAAIMNVVTVDKVRKQFHRIVVYNENLAEIVERHLRKGSKVFVEGQIETRKWLDKGGKSESWTVEIILNGFQGRLTILDDPPEASEVLADDADAPPVPLKRVGRDGLDDSPGKRPDKIDTNLPWLA